MTIESFTVGSLFSGYGGIELGLESTGGFRTLCHCEIEPYPAAILAERWPGCPNLGDITKVNWDLVERVDVLCGGFPCQDISTAGQGRGIKTGTRSGLWFEFLKAIRVLRPRYVLIENVSAITRRGLDIVLAGLAKEGYDAEWLDIRASDFGAPHKRERIFIIAYTNTNGSGHVHRKSQEHANKAREHAQREPLQLCTDVSYTASFGCEGSRRAEQSLHSTTNNNGQASQLINDSHWKVEPAIRRVVDGSSSRMDSFEWRERIKALGNGVVPQITAWLGERILHKEERENKGEIEHD